jgi:type IV secretory pathway VirD2 relaxase
VNSRDEDFNVRLGRIRDRGGGKSFVDQVLRAARKAGHGGSYTAGSRRFPRHGHSTFGRGRAAFGRGRLFAGHSRVVVKARVVRHRGRAFRSAPLSAHIAYLERDGVSRDGEKAHMFGAAEDRSDAAAFARRGHDDRHHFRFIVSPEDAAEMTDLKAFTRDLVAQMERDLGTRLDWVAVDHWNTDNPHVHLLVRGIAEDGSDLVISRDYISHGLRFRAEDLVSAELGPKPEHEIRSSLEREVEAERWTRLDVAIRMAADETGFIDLRPDNPGANDPEVRRLAIGRLQRLERMGLTTAAGPAQWMVGLDAEHSLRDLGLRGDIIKTMHRSFTERGQDRGIADYVIDTGRPALPIIGRLVDKGLHDELTGEAYAVIDGTDGRAHYVRLRGIEAFEHAPPIGGIVEVRQFGGPDDPRPTLVLANRSDVDLAAQVTARGATWLDHRLVERQPMPLAMGDRPATLYLVVPPSDISRTKPLIRLVLNQIGRRLTEELHAKNRRHRVLLMLDEFPALGRFDFFESALAFMAGYGLKSFLIAQSLNQIEKAYGPNNSILDNCHVRVCFATNDERTAKRVSDALGISTELRAMKNYAGHRLSPWLGHLMVSRQETARPLLTAGEVMQLPPSDELVLMSGCPPIRAKKARYFEDRRFAERILPPPKLGRMSEPPAPDEWSSLPPRRPVATPLDEIDEREDTANSGLRREPELPDHLAIAKETTVSAPSKEFAVTDDSVLQARVLSQQMRGLARQAALDPGDGLGL